MEELSEYSLELLVDLLEIEHGIPWNIKSIKQ